MGYRINYSTGKSRKKTYKIITVSPFVMASILLGVACIICFFVFSSDVEHTMHMLFPWTEPATKEAFLKMEESIHMGMSVTEALLTFCKELLSGVSV